MLEWPLYSLSLQLLKSVFNLDLSSKEGFCGALSGNCCVLSDKDRVCEGLVIIFVWLLYILFS